MHKHKTLRGNSIIHKLCRINASLKSVVSTFSNKTPHDDTDIIKRCICNPYAINSCISS